MKITSIIAFIVLTTSCFLFAPEVSAGQYTPEGLYDPEYFTLDNGLDVILKQRDVTHNVAIRLSVNVGQSDFTCGRQELPHFLEHLLFTGTSRHSEIELEALIEEHGGSWNAFTSHERTDYEIDIYSANSLLALDVLYEIITDSQITPENVDLTRDIIHREAGGKPSALRQWLYKRSIGRDASDNAFIKMFPKSNVVCSVLQPADTIGREDIVGVLREYYVPNNMLLVIVGEFNRDELVSYIKNNFETLTRKPMGQNRRVIPAYYHKGPSEFTGTLSPLVDSEASVGMAFRTDGSLSADIHSLAVIETFLNTRLYNTLRVEEGLSYSPQSNQLNWNQFGIFLLSADVDIDKMDTALDLMRLEVDTLRNGSTSLSDIENSRKKILLSWVQGFESNSDIADYYVSNHHELKMYGTLIDHESKIEKVTLEDVQKVAARYLVDRQSVIIREQPTLTYTQFYVLIGFLVILGIFTVWRVARKVRHRSERLGIRS
jgi:predicted Zn-dependent peptidase